MIAVVLVLLASGQQAKLAAPDDTKVRCRVEAVTGSLAQRTRVCHTEAQWRTIDRTGNEGAQQMIERGQQSCAGCPHGG